MREERTQQKSALYEAPEILQITISVEKGFGGSSEDGGDGGDL